MLYTGWLYVIATCMAALIWGVSGPVYSAEGEPPLSLQEAVQMALTNEDPSLARFHARADALENEAVADAQLPDPKISASLANVPLDSFAFDQSNMTQIKLGLRQEFPAGRTLEIKGDRRRAEAEAERARNSLTLREIALVTRNAWLDLAYHTRAMTILRESRQAVDDLLESLAARFATGGMHAQDTLRAELELSLIDDQLTEHQRLADVARAALARYIGRAAFRPLPNQIPELSASGNLAQLRAKLTEHPAVTVENAQIRSADLGIALAEEAYKPSFALEGGYGLRTDQADFASIGVTLSVPIFTDKRQDRRRAAAVQQHGAEQFDRDALLLELQRKLKQELATWQRLNERLELYRRAVGRHARDTAEASITTYANNQTDFAELIRSQLAELDIELKYAELETKAAKSWAQLAWLTGDPS